MCLCCWKVDGNQCSYLNTSCLKCHWHLNLRKCKTFLLTTRQMWQHGQKPFKLRCSCTPLVSDLHVRGSTVNVGTLKSWHRLSSTVPDYVTSVSSVTNIHMWRMYVAWLNYVCRLKELTSDFWFHTGHEQQSPEWKACVRLTQLLLIETFCSFCHLSSRPSLQL